MLTTEAITQFRAGFRGQAIAPADTAYDEARKVYNGMIDRKPALIAKCANPADVMYAVRAARENGWKVSVRGGGHNAAGLGIWDDAVVIDLSSINYVHVDPGTRTVRVGGGAKLTDMDHATHAFGLAVPAGIFGTTGVGGLTLGGGLGHLTRRHGLSIDNLLAADVVLADGTFVVASAKEHADLFWALRGGGGNFGIVTSFLFQAHPVHTVCAGPMLWELDQAPDLMRWYRDFIVQAPEDINGFFAFLTVPPVPPFPEALHMKKMCGIVWCHPGTMDQANALIQPLRQKLPPAFEFFVPMPYPMLQTLFDGLMPPGMQWYWKADFVNEINDAAVALHCEHGSKLPSPISTMHLYPINGAAHRVGDSETPWAYRKANWAEVIVGIDPDPANAGVITQWARDYWQALHPYSAGGAYVNFMMDEGEDRIRATYGANYDRLAAIKAKYDPTNFFSVNQNIKPNVAAANA